MYIKCLEHGRCLINIKCHLIKKKLLSVSPVRRYLSFNEDLKHFIMCWRKRIGWEGVSILQVTPGWSWTDSFMEQYFKEMAEHGFSWCSAGARGALGRPCWNLG